MIILSALFLYKFFKDWTMRLVILATGLILCSVSSFGQKTDTLVKKLDSLQTGKNAPQKNVTNPSAYNEQTKITLRNYFILLGSDLKQEFTAPFHFKKKDWFKFGGFALTELAL